MVRLGAIAVILARTIFGNIAGAAAPSGEESRTVTPDGAWCWFQDPRAVNYSGKRTRSYLGWITAGGGGKVQLAAYDPDSDSYEHAELATLHKDDHANPALHFLPDGRLMVFYSAHNGVDMFYRISKNPEDILDWGPEQKLGFNTPGKGITYPNPVQLAGEDNKLYLFWRGGTRQPAFSTSMDEGTTWTAPRELFRADKTPYLKVATDGDKTIHFGFTNDHPEYNAINNIYYMRYRNGALERADGTQIAMLDDAPVTPAQANLIYDAASGKGRAWIWDVAADGDGNPVLVFLVASHPPEHENRYAQWDERGWEHYLHYARWDGTRWQVRQITYAGSWFPETVPGKAETEPYYAGGIVLDHNDPSTVYLSRAVDKVFEIERWHTTDGGDSWTSAPITAGSNKLNVRPVVPRGPKVPGAEVFWMHGNYTRYVNYATAIKVATKGAASE